MGKNKKVMSLEKHLKEEQVPETELGKSEEN
jgi:hypothetical protein